MLYTGDSLKEFTHLFKKLTVSFARVPHLLWAIAKKQNNKQFILFLRISNCVIASLPPAVYYLKNPYVFA